jgi:signal recognition particle GTPase
MSKANSPPDRLQKPNDNHTAWLLRRVWDRVNRDNEHFMATIVGREGSGKSHTALKLAKSLDPSFHADRVIFDVAELLRVLKDGEHEPGNFYVLDEAGVSLGRRTWQDRSQILANQALQLIRSHNLGLVFTLPRLSELDSQTEGRLQAVLEITKKNPDEWVRVKWKFVDPDRIDSSGNILKKYPRRLEDGYKKRITRNTFAPPDDSELVDEYEERKAHFQESVYEETIEALDDAEEEEENEQRTVKDIATEIAKDGVSAVVSEHGNTGEPYINHQLIRAEHGITHDDAKAVKSLLDKQVSLSEDML